ncbi:MAG: serine/threonine protein kinase [Erysipelotrichaceae bacterium]|nr:serine/threonine protein kinase [Erysipelotrichaceae bacterium]
MKIGDIFCDRSGHQYVIIKELGRGGQAVVYLVNNTDTQTQHAFKYYLRDPFGVHKNIETLLKWQQDIILAKAHTIEEGIFPDDIYYGHGGSFGYLMQPLEPRFMTLWKAYESDNGPNAEVACHIIIHLSDFMTYLHANKTLSYKDINENNVYFDPSTGDVRVIDNDNIGFPSHFTIRGTLMYMAPEILNNVCYPDIRTDFYSLAMYIYRLLIGAFPYEGPYSKKYGEEHGLERDGFFAEFPGRQPLFVFDPVDQRNSIKNTDNQGWQLRCQIWESLPESVQNLFISTFATNISYERRAERTSSQEWSAEMKRQLGRLVKCPHCGELTFKGTPRCFNCLEKIEISQDLVLKINGQQLSLRAEDTISTQQCGLSYDEPLLIVKQNKETKQYALRNVSPLDGTVTLKDGTTLSFNYGRIIPLSGCLTIKLDTITIEIIDDGGK